MIITHSIISEKVYAGNRKFPAATRHKITKKAPTSSKHLIVNGGNLKAYARKQFTTHRQVVLYNLPKAVLSATIVDKLKESTTSGPECVRAKVFIPVSQWSIFLFTLATFSVY